MSEPTESNPPSNVNELGQVVGFPLPDWKPPTLPPHDGMQRTRLRARMRGHATPTGTAGQAACGEVS